MKQGSRLSEAIQLFFKDGAVHANRQDIAMIDIVNSTFHSIKRLFLSQNKIKHLHGMSQFKDLRILSLSYNYIEDFRELKYIPASVENLSLEGNPISNHPNYRLNVIENIPQLKILDTKPIKDSERKDIHEANQLADYIPKLLFALDKLCSKTYKDLVMLGAQVEQYRKYGNLSPNNVENEFEFSFPSYIPKNGEYKRCVKRIPPLSDVKDTRITVEGVRNLARNMFDETLINSTLDECNNVAELELDRFKLELKESIVKQYKEVKKYANAVACLEKEQKFVVYSGDQTQLYIFIKCMVQVANQLFERENERERLMTYLKYCEANMPKPVVKEGTNKTPTPILQPTLDKPKVERSEKEQTCTSQISKPQDETPRYQRNDSSNGSIEDDDTVVISEDQLTSPEKSRMVSVITAPDSLLEDNAFFLTKSTALHYKKWNKLFSKAKTSISVQECGGDEQEAERRADEYRNQKLKSKVLDSLKYYKDKKQEYRAHYEKKRKLKNIKARSFYVKSLQSKAFTALVQNTQRRQNFKRAIRILRKVRYELIMKKFFDSWRSLLLRCSDIRPLTAPPKPQALYDSDKEKPTTREESSKNKYYRRKDRPQSAGNALTKQKDKENEAEQNGYKQKHRYKEKTEVDGPVYVKKEKRRRKTVVMLSVASNF